MKKIIVMAALLSSTSLVAQEEKKPSIVWSGYIEAYYQYDFNKPVDNNRPSFIYSHNRHNEFNVNLGFLKGSYSAERVRANLAMAAGSYMNANYAAEPGVLKNIYEANAGIKISKKKNLWIDGGIMPSHIGFESAISKDCPNLTRSILADNSPYYEAGAKLSYASDNGKWLLSAMALNGWQRITRVSGNSLMSWGAQVQFKPSSRVLLNYSNFTGTDKPDSARLVRLFHNLYGIFNATDKLGVTAGFDIGTEQKSPGSKEKNTWYAPVLILRYVIDDKWALAGRVEHYNDKNEVIVITGTQDGFQTTGYSLNIDYSPFKNTVARAEIKHFDSKDKIFTKQDGATDYNTSLILSIAISF